MTFSGDPWSAVDWIEFYTAGGSVYGASIAIDDIELVGGAAPEPGSLGLLELAFVFGLARRIRG